MAAKMIAVSVISVNPSACMMLKGAVSIINVGVYRRLFILWGIDDFHGN